MFKKKPDLNFFNKQFEESKKRFLERAQKESLKEFNNAREEIEIKLRDIAKYRPNLKEGQRSKINQLANSLRVIHDMEEHKTSLVIEGDESLELISRQLEYGDGTTTPKPIFRPAISKAIKNIMDNVE